MPIEYEMMYLKKTVEEAIRGFSAKNSTTDWFDNAEYAVLDMLESDSNILENFQDYQVAAMRELVSRGCWIKWDENLGKSIIFRISPR